MSRWLEYSVLDVFAERALEGNPLAVFHDARSLSDDEMQAVARETNLSETTFVLPSDDPEEDRVRGVRVRIFTTQEELAFAGHPTLGTATWLHLNHPAVQGLESVRLLENVGPIEVTFAHRVEGEWGIMGTMRQNDPDFGALHDRAEVAKVLDLSEEDLLPGYTPQTVSTGTAFCIVALRSVETMRNLAIPQREATEWLRTRGARWFYCIAPTGKTGVDEAAFHARMQFYGGEDPATGSAAGCCISWMVKHGLVEPKEPVVIEQGIEIFRPSRITVQADLSGSDVRYVHVSGRTIPVATGAFFLP